MSQQQQQQQPKVASAPTKAELRARIFSEKRRIELVQLDDGLEVEVRATTVGQMLDAVSVEEPKARMAKMLVMSCFVPGTSERIFDDTDAEAIMEMPSGGYYQKLLDAINKEALERQAAEVKKNSGSVAPSTQST